MAPNVTRAASLRPNPNPIDPDVKVPAAVTRAREAAEAAQAAAYPDQVPEAPPAPPPSANSDGIVIAPPPPAPAPTPSVTPPGNELTPAPTPPAPPAPPAEDSWEHKFNSERGRRIKLEEQIRSQGDRMLALENMLQDIKSAPTAPAPTPAPARLITDQEENEFGPEMLDVMGRRAKEAITPELAELRATVASLEQKLTGTQTVVKRNARAEMLGTLDDRLPEWRRVNDMPEYKTWLALPDPYSGVIRHQMLLSAFEQNDTPRVLNFFKGFVSELAATTPAGDTVIEPPAPAPARPSLDTLAAPGRARTPAQVNLPAEKPIITTHDVSAFYAAVRRGEYRGRETEQAALERELFEAQREGRVRAT